MRNQLDLSAFVERPWRSIDYGLVYPHDYDSTNKAVAIGAGFGMQNLLKNLISGLMLLMERPFRSGDLVEVG